MDEAKNNSLELNEFPPVSTQEWEEIILADLKGSDYEKKLIWKTYEGFAVRPYYRAEDMEGLVHLSGLPGHPPYTRGRRMASNEWEIRQNLPPVEAAKAASLAADCLARGADAVGLHTGQLQSYEDFCRLMQGIPFPRTPLHFIAPTAIPGISDYLTRYAAEKGIPLHAVKGSLDIAWINSWIKEGGASRDAGHEMKQLAGVFNNLHTQLPSFRLIGIDARIFREAGSTLVQELAYGLALANEYLAALTALGLTPGELTRSMHFTFGIGSDYFLEIAKLRAARWLWGKVVEQYGTAEAEALEMYIHAETLNWNKTLYDPHVNMLRTTTEAMSAAIGGSDAISVQAYDEAFRQPDEFSLRIARNQQIILREEAYLGKTADPAGGSYYIEMLTDALAEAAWKLFQDIESKGGFIACFIDNSVQQSVKASHRQREADAANRKNTILGTNQYPNLLEEAPVLLSGATNPDSPGPDGVMALSPCRVSSVLEQLRGAMETHVKNHGTKPVVYLLPIGNLAMRKARASFSANFFGCGGYQVIDNQGFEDVAEAVTACLENQASIAVLCSSDDEYPELVPAVCKQLKQAGFKGMIVLAGYPKEQLEAYTRAGIDQFIHVRSNLVDTLRHFHQQLGINC